MADQKTIVVLGASGYVGARLTLWLLDRGYTVRVGGRSLSKLRERPWYDHPRVEPYEVDVTDRKTLETVLAGSWAVYYLVHSMISRHDQYEDMDRGGGYNLALAAEKKNVQRIIYLGGLGDVSSALSPHLRSRAEVGRILQSGKTPVTILRAAMIIGSGSASFEILRNLTHKLPVMVTPRWVSTRSQPIGIRNVLHYLGGLLERPETIGQTYDIGGSDIVRYRDLFDMYCDLKGLHRRIIIPVPVLSPKLSSYWIDLVTPVPADIARPLALGLRNEMICREEKIKTIIPQAILEIREAMRLALDESYYREGRVDEIDWLERPEMSMPGDAGWSGGRYFRHYMARRGGQLRED